MWHDTITFNPAIECEADPLRVCRGRLFGTQRICVKCGRPMGVADRAMHGRTREERLESWRRARSLAVIDNHRKQFETDLPF